MNTNNDRIQLANNLLLEPVFAVDFGAFLDLIVRNLKHNGRWLTWSKPDYSADDLKRYLAEQKAKWEADEAREYVVMFNSAVVGSVGLYRLDSPNRAPGIGYWLDEGSQGNGIITKSANALLDFAFETFDVNLVHINSATGNDRSRAVAERIGMSLDGVLRQRDRDQQGEFLDVACYSITRNEWQDLRASDAGSQT